MHAMTYWRSGWNSDTPSCSVVHPPSGFDHRVPSGAYVRVQPSTVGMRYERRDCQIEPFGMRLLTRVSWYMRPYFDVKPRTGTVRGTLSTRRSGDRLAECELRARRQCASVRRHVPPWIGEAERWLTRAYRPQELVARSEHTLQLHRPPLLREILVLRPGAAL